MKIAEQTVQSNEVDYHITLYRCSSLYTVTIRKSGDSMLLKTLNDTVDHGRDVILADAVRFVENIPLIRRHQ